MAEENNGKNSSIPRGYLTEDTNARLEWVKKFSGIELENPKPPPALVISL